MLHKAPSTKLIICLSLLLVIAKDIFVQEQHAQQVICLVVALLAFLFFRGYSRNTISCSTLFTIILGSFVVFVPIATTFFYTSAIWMYNDLLPVWIGAFAILPLQEFLQKYYQLTPAKSVRRSLEILFSFAFVAELLEWGIKNFEKIPATTYEAQIDIMLIMIGAAVVLVISRLLVYLSFLFFITKKTKQY